MPADKQERERWSPKLRAYASKLQNQIAIIHINEQNMVNQICSWLEECIGIGSKRFGVIPRVTAEARQSPSSKLLNQTQK